MIASGGPIRRSTLKLEAICKREAPASVQSIADGRKYLNERRDNLIGVLNLYTP